MNASVTELYQACLDHGANVESSQILAYIGTVLSKGDIAHAGPAGSRGAWNVSPDVWGEVPSTLAGQARQAARIFAEQIATLPWRKENLYEKCIIAAMAWYHPTATRRSMPIGVNDSAQEMARGVLAHIAVQDEGKTLATTALAGFVVIAIVIILGIALVSGKA